MRKSPQQTVAIAVLLALVALWRLGSVAPEATLTPTQAKVVRPRLRCSQVASVLRWVEAQRANGAALAGRDDAAASHAALLERIDPTGLVLTDTESAQLVPIVAMLRRSRARAGACRELERWYEHTLAPAQARLARLASQMTPPAVATKTNGPLPKKAARRTQRAHDEHQLEVRLREFAEDLYRRTDAGVVAAYGNTPGRFLKHSLQLYSEEIPDAPTAIAKAALAGTDPYADFLPEPEFREIYQELSGDAVGLGIRVRPLPNGLYVEEVVAGTVADRTKVLRAGDVIEEVDGQVLSGRSASDLREVLLGTEGSGVSLRVRRGEQLLAPFVLERRRYRYDEARVGSTVRTVEDQKIAVFTVPSFYGRGGLEDVSGRTQPSVSEDLERLMKESIAANAPTGVVLDLRGNPGGYVDEAVSMAGLFLGNRTAGGVIEPGDRRTLRSQRGDALWKGPLVVLVDGDSASAAEVLAGALKDQERALVVGPAHTFGKGTVQRLFRIGEAVGDPDSFPNGAVKMTVSRFYSPMGECPAGIGMAPHWVPPSLAAEHPVAGPSAPAERTTPFVDSSEESALIHVGKAERERVVHDLEAQPPMKTDALEEAATAAQRIARARRMAAATATQRG